MRAAAKTILAAALVAVTAAAPTASAAAPPVYHTTFLRGRIVPLDDSVPHAPGVMVDSRIVADLDYLATIYPIYVEEGYAGPLAGVGEVGCRLCHVAHSDHYNGDAVDILPLFWGRRGCDSSWRAISHLARWAEPRQNHPLLPFRWVGYNGDVDHGCGNHLHLSWDHARAPRFRLARWVTVFDVPETVVPVPPPPVPPTPTG